MKLATIAALIATASGQFGTTGHYGNAYAGPRNMEHAHVDHIYGYDSVPVRKDLKSGTGLTNNGTRRDAIIAKVGLANTDRKTYFN